MRTMQDPAKLASDLVQEMRETFGARLRSVLLYGSVPRGEYIEGVSNINVLVLVDEIDPATLRAAAPHALRWSASGLVPLLLEADEWARAADVFAIEVLDMLDVHSVLHGIDPLQSLQVSAEALRLQAERELRGKLVTLHSGMMAAAEKPEALGDLLRAALPSYVTYVRAALRLAGQLVPSSSGAVIDAGARAVSFDAAGFHAAREARQQGGKWKVGITDRVMESYHAAAERLAAYVDRIAH